MYSVARLLDAKMDVTSIVPITETTVKQCTKDEIMVICSARKGTSKLIGLIVTQIR